MTEQLDENEVILFTNIDEEDYEAMWGGKTKIIQAGKTESFPRFLANHYAKHLINKILIKKGKDFGDSLAREPLLAKILEQPSQVVSVLENQNAIPTEPEFPKIPKEPEAKSVEEVKLAENLKCDICGKVVKNEIGLRLHRGKFHKK